jgi:hypothetical protein
VGNAKAIRQVFFCSDCAPGYRGRELAPGCAATGKRSDLLGEGLQICTAGCRTEEDMQASGINDVFDFFAKSIGNPIKSDFQYVPFGSGLAH